MSVTATPRPTSDRLPRGTTWLTLAVCWLVAGAVFGLIRAAHGSGSFNLVGAVFFGTLAFDVVIWMLALLVEGRRRAADRLMTSLVTTAFVVAMLPLVSLVATVIGAGLARLDTTYFTESMRNVIGSGGGALHAIVGTLEITGMAALISVPVGLMAAVYLVEYGRGALATGTRFLVDVMTGIPSIVAGLFAFALFALITGDAGIRSGFVGSVALSVLMLPVVVRSSEEVLRLVPNELREASLALGVPRWLTVLKVVLPTAASGLMTGVILAIARVIGETAPLLIVAGFTTSMNYDLFSGRMMTLPVFVYTQYTQAAGLHAQAAIDRAWTGALVLMAIVLLLNIIGRIATGIFGPRRRRR